jgi:uncharacterized protein YqeY
MTSDIYLKIREDIKTAMKARESSKVSCLRLIDSEIQNESIKARKEISNEMAVTILNRGIKQREDASEIFKKASRQDLVAINDYEISIYKIYKPLSLTTEELSQIVDQVITEVGAISIKQIGNIMSKIIPLVKGRADGKIINQMVKDKLPKE